MNTKSLFMLAAIFTATCSLTQANDSSSLMVISPDSASTDASSSDTDDSMIEIESPDEDAESNEQETSEISPATDS